MIVASEFLYKEETSAIFIFLWKSARRQRLVYSKCQRYNKVLFNELEISSCPELFSELNHQLFHKYKIDQP